MSDRPILVAKIGSNSLVDQHGRLDLAFLDRIAAQFAAVHQLGWQVVLVTSGAVASGVSVLGLKERPPGLPERQALAAIGQVSLAHRWEAVLAKQHLPAAQLLLTYDDFVVRSRYLNLAATFKALFAFGAVPVINENDPVAVEELTVGDNDRLSALVATMLGAKKLVLLTDIDGMYDADPRSNPAAKRIPLIPSVTAKVLAAAGGAGARGRGGMRSKIEAARLASGAGCTTHICLAREPKLFERLLAAGASGASGAESSIGTTVPGRGDATDLRRRWLAVARRVKGSVHIDAGAVTALTARGRSLLPAGITRVDGRFERGDTIAILSPTGDEIARGLCSFSAEELSRIAGKRMDAAAKELGWESMPKAAVQRDDLLVLVGE